MVVNELMITANEIEYKNARLVMLPADAITTSQIALHILGVFSFLLLGKSCRVQLSTQGLFYPVVGDRWMLELTLGRGNLLVGSARIFLTLRT